MSIQEQLQEIKENGLRELENFADAKELDSIRVRYLGKKGELTAILKQMGKLSPEERPVVGQLANEVRQALEAAVAASQEKLKEKEPSYNRSVYFCPRHTAYRRYRCLSSKPHPDRSFSARSDHR